MRPLVGAAWNAGCAVVQIGLAGALSGVVAGYLSGDFPLDGAEAGHTVTCGLSYRGDGVCTAAFASTAVSVLLSLLILAFQCAAVSADGSAPRGATFCGPILSLIGFAWWLAFGAAATSAALSAAQWDSSLTAYRTTVVALSWALMCSFIVSFFLSAAAASASARARAKLSASLSGSARGRGAALVHPDQPLNGAIDPALAIKIKRFNQPLASPPVSPSKSGIRSFNSSHYDVFNESESPKKWAQPMNKNRPHAVTSDGLRTLVLLGGEPVALSAATSAAGSPCNMSPSQSPHARSPFARSPTLPRLQSPLLHRLQRQDGGGGSGASAGSFRNVLLPPGADPSDGTPREQLP